MDQFGLVQAVDGFGQRIVVAADRKQTITNYTKLHIHKNSGHSLLRRVSLMSRLGNYATIHLHKN